MSIPEQLRVTLERLGLTEPEIAVYLASLELGPRPASVIAKRANLKRGHAYNVLNSLAEKGIIQQFEKNHVRYYSSSSPQSLLSILEVKELEFKQDKEIFLSYLPVLENLKRPSISEPRVRIYQGLSGIREALDDTLRHPELVIYEFADPGSVLRGEGPEVESLFQHYALKRIERGIWLHAIAPRSPGRAEGKLPLPAIAEAKRRVKRLEGLSLPAAIMIYGEKALIISTVKPMMAAVIDDGTVAASLLSLHETLWRSLPESKETRAVHG
jgi:sugar-specific transcriptional regulator TrmB